MSTTYFDGFDIHRVVSSPGFLLGQGDFEYHWGKGSTGASVKFVEGYPTPAETTGISQTGQAIAFDNNGIGRTLDSGNATRTRFGFWTTLDGPGTGTRQWFCVGGSGNGWYKTRLDLGTGQIEVFYNPDFATPNGVDGSDVSLGTFSTPISNTTWTHVEFYVSNTEGIQIRINNTATFSAAAQSTNAWNSLRCYVNVVTTPVLANATVVDHFYQTNGDPLSGNPIEAVSVAVAADVFEGQEGFQGHIVFGNIGDTGTVHYKSAPESPLANSGLGGGNNNWCNVINYVFSEDPRDNADWTIQKLAEIEHWGLCYFNWFSDTAVNGRRARVVAASFNILWHNNGMPVVTYQPPAGMVAYDGTWSKSTTTKGFTQLINTIPRPNVANLDQSDWIAATAPAGCLTFTRTDNRTTIPGLGISFAQEFQTYPWRDWQRVNGIGTGFSSFFVTGYSLLADGDKDFQSNYVTVNYESLQGGSCFIQGVWDYSVDPQTGRWSQQQQVYFTHDPDYTHRLRKLKIRGSGEAMQIRVTSDEDNPFSINGWTIYVTAENQV